MTEPESPRLRSLLDEVRSEPAQALQAFWAEIEASRGPLVECVDEDETLPLVTFVWRASESLQNVLLLEWFSGGDFADKQCTHLPGTDVWYRSFRMRSNLRTSYQFAENDSLVSKFAETDWETRRSGWKPDPFNPDFIVDDEGTPAHHSFIGASVLSLPDAEPQPWLVRNPEVADGTVEHRRFTSTVLGNERDIWLYRPEGGRSAVNLVISFDGDRAIGAMGLPATLDNLQAAGKIPPTAALMIGNADRNGELPPNPAFVRMLVEELIPLVQSESGVTFGPEHVIVAGQSYGGLCAAWCAFTHPDVFGNVLSQSGSFWWKPDPRNLATPQRIGDAPAYGWLIEEVATRGWPGARIWMEAGTLEALVSDQHAPSLAESNRRMRDVLVALRAEVTYREFAGGHDWACWRGSIADGIVALSHAGSPVT